MKAILIKLPAVFFAELEQIISRFGWKSKKPRIAKAIMRKKNGTAETSLHDFKLYYKATVINRVWYWHKDRSINQWNKIERPEINICTYGQLIFDKGGKNIQRRKDSPSNKWCWENWSAISKRMKSENSLTPCKVKSLSRDRLCATPQMAAHQAPPSLGFSRQEHWSGLPFPFPMHESEK